MTAQLEQVMRERDEARDCGQNGVCAIAPGCQRHWAERNRELQIEVERCHDSLRCADLSMRAYAHGVAERQREACCKALAAWLREVHATGLPHETPEALADAVDAGEVATPLVTDAEG